MNKQQAHTSTEHNITTRQQSVIDIIQTNLNIVFVGNTKKDASQFISENIDVSKRKSNGYIKTNISDS